MYITIPASHRARQITIKDFLEGNFSFDPIPYTRDDLPYTRTFKSAKMWHTSPMKLDMCAITHWLEQYSDIILKKYDLDNMNKYYRHYEIPKKSGGYRPIDDPSEDLSDLKADLKQLRNFFQRNCRALYHTSAYAYINNRGIRDERNFHARQGSRWFCYLDFHNFFGSITYDFAWEMLSQIYPFCEIINNSYYKKAKEGLKNCLKLCFLNGGLPQGTPISPMLTNLLLIPFDFELSKKLIHNKGQAFYYTRYADDICVSSKYDFNVKTIEQIVLDTIKEIGAPFELNRKKTHYCSRSGHNFHLGLMYNDNGDITVGYKKKDNVKAALTNFALDTKANKYWHYHDVQVLLGQYQFCVQQEPEYFAYVIKHLSDKFGIDIYREMIEQIKKGAVQ